MKKIYLTLLFLILVSANISADTIEPVTATGEAAIANVTPEDAQNLALKRARLEAIEKVCGIRLKAETFVHNFSIQDDFIHSVSYGHIISEEILRWEVEVIQPSEKQPPAITYRVTLKARVQKIEEEPDPFYQVKVKLNKTVFENGDEMLIFVSSTKSSHITVLNYCADGSVVLLFPNQIQKNNYIKAGEKYQIPDDTDRANVLNFQVSTLLGHKQNNEYIKVIATREPISLFDEISVKGPFGTLDTAKFAAAEVGRLVSSIPVKDRAEATVMYQIISTN